MIDVRGLVVAYGDRRVLHGVDLQVERGETVVLMGSSGGGKTTLLKAVAGLIPSVEGSVTVDGVDARADGEEARRRMGMVFQNGALLDYMTVGENVSFALERRRVAPKERAAMVDRALESAALALTDGAKMPDELSGGMRKRAGIARAIALRPPVLLYDEPTTGLDPVTTYQIDGLVRSLQRSEGVTSLVVSHDLASVRRIADRVAFLHRGDVVFVGPYDAFVASDHPAIRETVGYAFATAVD